MKLKETIFITLTAKWSVRNLIVTGVLDEVALKYNIVLLADSKLLDSEYAESIKKFTFYSFDTFSEKKLKVLFRQLKKAFIFKGAELSTEKIWKKYVKRPFYQNAGDGLISFLIKLINFKWLFNLTDSIEWAVIKDNKFDSLFKKHTPKFIMVSYLNIAFDESAIRSAIDNNIPIRYLLMSWDHLTTKVVMNNHFDLIYVWTQINKNEILEFYSRYSPEQIKVVGPPQFTVYNDQPVIRKESFLASMGVKNGNKILLYSAAPLVRHTSQIGLIIDFLTSWNRLYNTDIPLHIIFKIHPLDNLKDFYLLKEHSQITLIDHQTSELFKKYFAYYDEVIFNRDLLYYSDINVNVYSSVTLEAFLLVKPVIHIAYQKEFQENTIPCKEYYHFSHFQRITNSGASTIVYSEKEFVQFLHQYLIEPGFNGSKRAAFNASFWGDMSMDFKNNLVKELCN
jgi:hypothetical protein